MVDRLSRAGMWPCRLGVGCLALTLGCHRPPPGEPQSPASSPPTAAPTPHEAGAEQALPAPARVLARDDLRAYHGWLKYLEFRANRADDSSEPGSADNAWRKQLETWSRRALDNPQALAELRGVHEWAYLSRVDGSGQPFRLNIPTDYDPGRPTPLTLLLHGYSGNHLEHTTDMRPHPGYFEASVLGRSRGAGFRGLGEADVLAVLEYLGQHFNIDARRVHLGGGSMGGGASYWLASRYPERFASVRVACGWASDKPLGNLLTTPIYALHSDDDFNVPVLHSRGPLARLRQLGGQVEYEEVTGYGHAVWLFAEGTERATQWFQQQVVPEAKDVMRIDFTALDGSATRAHWAELAEWGPLPKPARFKLSVTKANSLEAEFENARSVRLMLAESPFVATQPLSVHAEGKQVASLSPPLPDSAVLERTERGWSLAATPRSPATHLHSPGGANQLYDGTPLLIVYGTRGDARTRSAMRTAADAASLSSNASWPIASKDVGNDAIPHNHNLYGSLQAKPDHAVTDDDITSHHLVLIGTTRQNSVVARLADHLPVRYSERGIEFSDGEQLSAEDRALGVVVQNPRARGRLVFWVAASDPNAYQAGALIPELMARPTGADVMVTTVSRRTLVTTRSFDSRWVWSDFSDSAMILPAPATLQQLEARLALGLRRFLGADFGLAGGRLPLGDPPLEPGTTRLSDLFNLFYFEPIGVLKLSGRDLASANEKLRKRGGPRLIPKVDPSTLVSEREYSVAVIWEQLFAFAEVTRIVPKHYDVAGYTVADALEQHGLPRDVSQK